MKVVVTANCSSESARFDSNADRNSGKSVSIACENPVGGRTMREFFKGWKRKLGCATLIMACVFAVGWMRSYTTTDLFGTRPGKSFLCLVSIDRSILLIHARHADFYSRWNGELHTMEVQRLAHGSFNIAQRILLALDIRRHTKLDSTLHRLVPRWSVYNQGGRWNSWILAFDLPVRTSFCERALGQRF